MVEAQQRRVPLRTVSDMYDLKMSWLYARSRLPDGLPGAVKIGRHIRVNLDEFEEGVRNGKLSMS